MRKSNSYTVKTLKLLEESIKSKTKEDVDSFIYTAADGELKLCKGCNNCFETGCCIFENDDDLKLLKEKMISADVIVWASPVYAHNVSGITKNFIDRLSSWLYTFELSGKIGITVSISNSNGNIWVDKYLNKIMSLLGICIVNNLSIKTSVLQQHEVDELIEKCTDRILEFYNDKGKIFSNNIQEEYFQLLKNALKIKSGDTFYEQKWRDRRYFNYDTYSQLIKSR